MGYITPYFFYVSNISCSCLSFHGEFHHLSLSMNLYDTKNTAKVISDTYQVIY